MMQCLTNIIGITESNCPCIVNGLTNDEIEELRLSTSGLYLDNLEGGVHLKAIKYADACKSFMEMARDAINGASTRLEHDLATALNAKYQKAKKGFSGDIGRMSFAANLANDKQWQGIRIEPYDYSDAVIILNKFYLAMSATVNFTLRLLRVPVDSVMGDEIQTWAISAIANTWYTQNLTSPLKLPTVWNDMLVEYWLVYDRSESVTPFFPKDNKLECSECEKNKSSKIGDFVRVTGVGFDSNAALNNKISDSKAHGLVVNVTIKCDNETLFCREYAEDDAVAITMAWACLYKAGELLIEEVLKSPDINRYTTMAREYLWGKRNHFRKEYEARINYLVSVIDLDDSNCYVCREVANQPVKGTIFK